jgi:transketolase
LKPRARRALPDTRASGNTGRLPRLGNADAARKAHRIRADVVRIALRNEAGHIAPSLSCIDILAALYYCVMNIAADPEWEGRDRLIFSKAHGCYGVYAILAELGYLGRCEWEGFYRGSSLCGCIERSAKNGIEASCGSLGHGLPLAVGTAFGARLRRKTYHVYCIVGDGEMQEGSNWEAIQFAVRHRLANLTVIVDANGLQAMDFISNVMGGDNHGLGLADKLSAFGMHTATCDGHSIRQISSITQAWAAAQDSIRRPQALIAETVKGYGLLCMENTPKFHFRLPTGAEMDMGNRYERRHT